VLTEENKKEIFEKLLIAYDTTSDSGVIHADPELYHVYIHENGAMLIDWDSAEHVEVDEARKMNRGDLENLKSVCFPMKS